MTQRQVVRRRLSTTASAPARVAGLVLAAGAGRRMGTPKALLPGALARSVEVLRRGGCGSVTVTLGAAYDQARTLLPDGVEVVRVEGWATGMGAALRAGLQAVSGDAALVHLVDLPDVGPEVARRVIAHARADALVRATYHGQPGHPVLIGREHWAGVRAAAVGDAGARDYLREHAVLGIPCEDLATGGDADHPRDVECP